MRLFVSDIDGTLTYGNEPISEETAAFLRSKKNEGYEIILITGRNFSFVFPLLKYLDFPFYLGLYNGSLLISMPNKTVIYQKYLPLDLVLKLSVIFEKSGHEFIVESGIEENDIVYFRKERFSEKEVKYFSLRQIASNCIWKEINCFYEMNIKHVPILKCFADKAELYQLMTKIKQEHDVQITIIEDPFKIFYALLLTHNKANKGLLLKNFISEGLCKEIIVCGNDLNDLSMLELATKKVVIENSPQELLDIADVIIKKPQERSIAKAFE